MRSASGGDWNRHRGLPAPRPMRGLGPAPRRAGPGVPWRRVLAGIAIAVFVGALIWLRFGDTARSGGQSSSVAHTTPIRAKIVSLAQSRLGYSTAPADTLCNTFSAYWGAGQDDCGNGNLDEAWCADFAAWAWKEAGAHVVYGGADGDLNAGAVSFYRWGVTRGVWHPAGSGYTPQPGDVAVYGLSSAGTLAQHVAVVTGYEAGNQGPDVINGDGSRTGFSVVESGADQYEADIHGDGGRIAGYVSPA